MFRRTATENKTINKKKLLEVLVITLFLTYGMHYFGYFIRVRYFNLLSPLAEVNPGLNSVLHYLGHLIFWGIFAIYCFTVKGERKYFEAFFPGKGNNKVWKLLAGMSILSSTANGSSFFYNTDFGVEGSIWCIIVHIVVVAILLVLIKKKGIGLFSQINRSSICN